MNKYTSLCWDEENTEESLKVFISDLNEVMKCSEGSNNTIILELLHQLVEAVYEYGFDEGSA